MKYGLGLVIGKFYPPHRGHKLLIDEAVAQSERAVVIVCGKPTDAIPGELRGQWLQEIHPAADVMVIGIAASVLYRRGVCLPKSGDW